MANSETQAPKQTTQTNLSLTDLQEFMKLMRSDDAERDRRMAAMIAAAVSQTVAELRKPSAEEQARADKEREAQKQRALNAAQMGKAVDDMIKAQQAGCGHTKPNGDHTFRGQVHADGWATIRCVRCLVEFRVKPLPAHIASGLNLQDVKGLRIEHLITWQEQSLNIERQLNEAEEIQRRAYQNVTTHSVPKAQPPQPVA